MRFTEIANGARDEVVLAQEALERVPKNYGGHRSGDLTSTIDNTPEVEYYRHDDGRVLRLIRMLDDGPGFACLVANRYGKQLVVPGYRLELIGA